MYKLFYTDVSTASNKGIRAEQNADFLFMGEVNMEHDNVPYNMGSDIEALHISVKSSRFTLVSGKAMQAQDFEGQLAEYMANTASTQVAYMAMNMVAYVMNMVEFEDFVRAFCKLEKDSSKNGGYNKIRCKHESKHMIEWLEAHI